MKDSPEQATVQRPLLIIDDQRSVGLSLEFLLAGTGCRILIVQSGAAAIAVAGKVPFDGALIDVHLPVMNGFDMSLRLQTQLGGAARSARFWFMTGACTRDVQRRGAEFGALGMFKKPFDSPSFLEQLGRGFFSSPRVVQPVGEPSVSNGADDASA